ncbi:HAD family hydrolase [Geopseudomonas aromaticivorans]
MSTAVIFDAFGTLLKIQGGQHPYLQLLKLGKSRGRSPRTDDIDVLMQQPLTLSGAAQFFGIQAAPDELAVLEQVLADEIERIESYPDGVAAVRLLQSRGIRVGVCSNLAFPYSRAIRRCYPSLDAYLLSSELGVMKPDLKIYQHACEQLDVEPQHACMIGDSQRCDRDGPTALGIEGLYLDRNDGAGDYADLLSFAQDVLSRL